MVVSNLDPTATFTQLLDRDDLPDAFVQRVDAIDHRAAYFQIHFALSGLPEFTGPYEVLNEGDLRRNVTFFGTAEQMQLDYEGCVGGSCPGRRRSTCRSPRSTTPSWPRPASTRPAASPSTSRSEPTTPSRRAPRRDGERMVAKIAAMAPNFPDLIERQFNYPAYTYELMFGCTGGDFTHGLLQPEFMGPFRPGPRGWPDNPVPVDGLYLCGAGCHGGPGVTFIPGYNCGYAVLDAVASSRS